MPANFVETSRPETFRSSSELESKNSLAVPIAGLRFPLNALKQPDTRKHTEYPVLLRLLSTEMVIVGWYAIMKALQSLI